MFELIPEEKQADKHAKFWRSVVLDGGNGRAGALNAN